MKQLLSKLSLRFFLAISLTVLFGTLSIQFAWAAWSPPFASPPGGNVAAPLNTSSVHQTKLGGLTVDGNFTLTSDSLLFENISKGIIWNGYQLSEPHINFSESMNQLYLSAGDTGDGIELQGNVYITEASPTNPGSLTIASPDILDCNGDNTLKVDVDGALICAPDLQGAGGNINGSGAVDKVTVFADVNTVTYDDVLQWDRTNHRLGVGTNSPQTTLQVDGTVRLGLVSYQNCNTIDTDANGALVCGTDESGGNALWENGTEPNTIAPINSNVTQVAIGHNSIADATSLSVKNNTISSAIYAEQSDANGYAGYFSGGKTAVMNGNMGIGDTTPASALTVGNGDLFQVNDSGNLVKIRNVPYSWTTTQASGSQYLKNDGAGNLAWVSAGLGGTGVATRVAFWKNGSELDSNADLYWDNNNTNLGIGDSTPTADLTIGNGDLFQVNNSGDLVRIRNIPYEWPDIQGANNTYLTNNGSGSLTWSGAGADTYKIKVSSNDTTSNFLGNKFIAGTNITFDVNNIAGNETITVNAAAGGGLPAGTAGQTLRHDGSAWVATSNLYNNGTSVGVNQTNPVGRFVVNQNINGVGSAGDAVAAYANTPDRALFARQNNSSAYAGYFSGNTVVMSGNLGIGTEMPDQKYTQVGGNMLHKFSDTERPQMLDYIAWPGHHLGEGVYVSGEYAYVIIHNGSEGDEFRVVDVHNPLDIKEVGSLNLGGWENGKVVVAGRYAYVAKNGAGSGLKVIDISKPSAPTLVGSLNIAGIAAAVDLFVQGRYVFIGTGDGFRIVNIENPAAPTLYSTYSTTAVMTRSFFVSGRYVYLVGWDTDDLLRIIDINDLNAPAQVGSLSLGAEMRLSVFVQGRYAYVGTAEPGLWRFKVVDVSNPTAPTFVGELADGITPTDEIFIQGNYAYTTGGWGGAYVVDIHDPINPVRASDRANLGSNIAPEKIFVSGKYAYYSCYGSQGVNDFGALAVVDISGLGNPAVTTGAIEAGWVGVYENATLGNNLKIGNSLNVGPRGIKADGPVQAGDLGFWNGFNFTERGDNGLALAAPTNTDVLNVSRNSVGLGTTADDAFRLKVAGNIAATGLWLRSVDSQNQLITDALAKLKNLTGHLVADRGGAEQGAHYGFSIDELERVLPEAVKTDADGNKYVSNTQVVPLLVEAIREQQAKIAELKQRLQK